MGLELAEPREFGVLGLLWVLTHVGLYEFHLFRLNCIKIYIPIKNCHWVLIQMQLWINVFFINQSLNQIYDLGFGYLVLWVGSPSSDLWEQHAVQDTQWLFYNSDYPWGFSQCPTRGTYVRSQGESSKTKTWLQRNIITECQVNYMITRRRRHSFF